MQEKKYQFIGNKEFLKLLKPELIGHCIKSVTDVENWIMVTNQKTDMNYEIISTFIIDLDYNLRINDRHSEHVVCANGEPVLSAGEITFELKKSKVIRISQITNQSTGYCPSVKSWDSVKIALNKTKIDFPEFFTTEFIFRICEKCGWINVIKDNYFYCINCENEFNEY